MSWPRLDISLRLIRVETWVLDIIDGGIFTLLSIGPISLSPGFQSCSHLCSLALVSVSLSPQSCLGFSLAVTWVLSRLQSCSHLGLVLVSVLLSPTFCLGFSLALTWALSWFQSWSHLRHVLVSVLLSPQSCLGFSLILFLVWVSLSPRSFLVSVLLSP